MSGGWADLGLLPEIVAAVEEKQQWRLPTGIQDESIPMLLGGADVLGSAETGSGKTAAFGLPILQLAVEHKESILSSEATTHYEMGAPQIKPDPIQLSIQDRAVCIALHPTDSCRMQSRNTKEWAGCRASAGVSLAHPGKYAWEAKVMLDDKGIVRVGWSTADASLSLGTDAFGYGYGGTGTQVHGNKYSEYPSKPNKISFGKGDVIGCFLEVLSDETALAKIYFSKNGAMLDQAIDIPKKNNNDAMPALFPTICVKNAECQAAFDKLQHGLEEYSSIESARERNTKAIVFNPRDASSVLPPSQSKKMPKQGPFAIVIEPTRDLAKQTFQFFEDMIQSSGLQVQAALLIGGVKPMETLKKLEQGKVDILVGTPPIVASHVKKGTILTANCRFYCLDEADELITTDSIEPVKSIYARLLAHSSAQPSSVSRLQVCFFSATLHDPKVQALAQSLCHRPMWVDLRGQNDSTLPDTVHHMIVRVPPVEFNNRLEVTTDGVHREGKLKQATTWSKLSEKELESERIKLAKPKALLELIDKFQMDQVLIFCRTNLDCDLLEQFLNKSGGGGPSAKYTCRVLAGMRSMQARETALKDFKGGEVRILIATDVAARGIDIRELPFVVNLTLPDRCPATYVHRIGRVGRAERMGLAISLVSTVEERVWFCRKPKKPPCDDTRDFDKGGNCIWYSEPQLFRQIEGHLAKNDVKATKLEWPNFEIPEEVEAVLKGGGYGNLEGISVDRELVKKMNSLEGSVKQVEQTETNLQNNYWKLKNRFRRL